MEKTNLFFQNQALQVASAWSLSQETFRTRESGNTSGKTAYVRLYQVDYFQHLQGNTLHMECRFLLCRIKQMPLENLQDQPDQIQIVSSRC